MARRNYFVGALAVSAGILAAVGMLVLMTLVIKVQPAEASFPGQNGKIAFESHYRAGNWEIYAINPDGTALDRLTNTPAEDADPAWSPDGKKIAFLSSREGGNAEIYTMNSDGTGVTRLTNNPARDSDPAWSPDGNRIAFTSERDGNQEIYAMNANGTALDQLTTAPALPKPDPQQDRLPPEPPRDDLDPDWQPLSTTNPTLPNTTTTAPNVLSTLPQANATGVAPSASITATFSKEMLASSINETTFKLFEKGSTTKIAATVSYSAATHKATLDPTNPLRSGATYKAVVTTGAKDQAGNPLDQSGTTPGLQKHKWVFTVS